MNPFRSTLAPLLSVLFLAAGLTPTAQAAFPRQISNQGLLLDAGGAPVPNGNYDLTFRLYSVRTGGTAFYSEGHTAVPVTQGTFTVDLGALVPLPLSAFADSCFLGTQLGSDPEFTPRVLLTMAPFAARAAAVEDGAITGAAIADSNVVRSVNGLKDAVTLAAGSNIGISQAGSTVTISATGTGLTLPFASTVASNTQPLFSVTNSGGNEAGDFRLTGSAGAGMPALLAQHSRTNGIAFQANGAVRSGTTGFPGNVQVTQTTAFDDPDVQMSTTTSGGRFDLNHRLSSGRVTMEAISNRQMRLFASETSFPDNGYELTAFLSNADRHRLQLTSDTQVITLLAGASTADSSVQLPAGAIDANEIGDEPGVASSLSGTTAIALTGGVDVLLSRTISAPAAGFVLVFGTAQAQINQTSGTSSSINVGVSEVSNTLPANQDVAWALPSSAATGTYAIPATVHGLFQVAAGDHTFYLLAQQASGSGSVTDRQLTAVFFPTAYGTVTPTLMAGGSDDSAVASLPLGAADLAAESAEHQRWRDSEARRELDDLRSRLAALEKERADERRARERVR